MVHGHRFDEFWASVVRELDEVPLDVDIQRSSFYSEPEWDVFEVRYTGLGGYRLFAWMSVPRGQGPFPALVQMPSYGSAVDIPYTSLRREAVVLDASHRGQRRSDTPFQAHYPGLLTEGIGIPHHYIMRGVYADALRAVDVVLPRDPVDSRLIAVSGSGLGGTLGLAAGAFRSQVSALAVDTPIMLGATGALDAAGAYPLEEIRDYARTYPDRREAVLASLESFSPAFLAPRVACPVLLSLGARDLGQCPPPLGEELAAALGSVEVHQYPGGSEGGGHRHSLVRTPWLRRHLGIE